MIGIPFLSHLLAEKMFEKNVWFFFPDFREVILKVFPGSKRAEIATIRFVGPELSRLYFLGAKKSSKFIEFWHFQNGSFLRFLTPTKKNFLTPNFHPPPPTPMQQNLANSKNVFRSSNSPYFALICDFLGFWAEKIGFLAISRREN